MCDFGILKIVFVFSGFSVVSFLKENMSELTERPCRYRHEDRHACDHVEEVSPDGPGQSYSLSQICFRRSSWGLFFFLGSVCVLENYV